MTRGERHAYEEHLTNVVILEDAIETAEEIGKLSPCHTARHSHDCRPAFAGMRADVCRNAGRQSWKCRKTDLAGFDTIGTFDIGLLNYI